MNFKSLKIKFNSNKKIDFLKLVTELIKKRFRNMDKNKKFAM